jgi:hypothetical protein
MILDQQVSSKKEAYEMLGAYLPSVKLSPDTSGEFMYQINRPVPSKTVAGWQINRLSKWMALLAHMVEMGHGGQMTTKELSVVRLELDINTNLVAAVPLPKGKDTDLLSELALDAFRIASEGDVAS